MPWSDFSEARGRASESDDGCIAYGPGHIGASVRGLPLKLAIGAGTALRLDGVLEFGTRPVRGLRVRFGDFERAVDGWGLDGGEVLWWSVLPVPSDFPSGKHELRLAVDCSEGGRAEVPVGQIDVSSGIAPPGRGQSPTILPGEARIAICMATYEPDEVWLQRQLDSIRAQTRTDWVCLISDDASSPEAFAALEQAVGGDERFVVARSPERVGFYANFERALGIVPPGAELIALCDQDDRWHPGKLEALVATLDASPGSTLAYSDMRIVDESETVLSDSFWYLRRNRCDDIASLLIANTVTGAASLFRRELLDLALPFPPGGTSEHYHDQWLALCALATGPIAYLDRPTYDYTRHIESVTIEAAGEWYIPPRSLRERAVVRFRRLLRRLRMGLRGPIWREMYLDRILMIRQLVAVLELRAGRRIPPAHRRSLDRLASPDTGRTSAWLSLRLLRPLIGRNETLGRERILIGAIVWRALVERRGRRG